MSSWLPLIIPGIAAGSVYALAGVGLVLTYKTSGIFNFAYGALGTIAAYVFYWLNVENSVAWPIAAAIAVLVVGPILGIGFESFGRELARRSVAWQVAATVGLLISVEAVFTIIFGPTERIFPHFLPMSTFRIDSVNVTYEQLIVTLISLFATAGLYVLFRVSRVGMAMRAIVESPKLLSLTGTNPRNVGRWAWVIGCCFATLSGLLLAPDVNLDPTTLTLLIVQAFGAAAIGRFDNLPLTWIGGLVIGVLASIATKYGPSNSILAGLAPSVPFIVLFLVLLLSRRTNFNVRQLTGVAVAPKWRPPPRTQALLAAAVLTFFIFVPSFAGYQIGQWTIVLADALLLLSLGLLARVAGQISLCQMSFAAIGATAFSKMAIGAGIPWLLALVLAGLIAIPIGAVLAIPAIRFSGLYLALATFGFGFLLQDMFYPSSVMFGTVGLDIPLPHLSWLSVDSNTGFYYVVLAITVILMALVVILVRTRLGRLLRGIGDSPVAMRANGSSVNLTLVLVFCLSAFIAAVSGVLNGAVLSQVTGANYSPILSLELFVVVMITVGSEPWYALTGAAALVLVPLYLPSSNTAEVLQILFGVTAVTIALMGQPQIKFVQRVQLWLERAKIFSGGTVALSARVPPLGEVDMAAIAGASDVDDIGLFKLEVNEIWVRFGGLLAVSGFSITAPTGTITGLIGPNGAGKSTVLGVCTGLITPNQGHVYFGGSDVNRVSTAGRARKGLGRTFQHTELFDSMTVRENVAMGWEAASAGGNITRQFMSSRTDRDSMAARVDRSLQLCELEDIADQQAGSLPSGQRRLVEIARCLAGPFRLLLLDEPSSGLNPSETERLGELLVRLVEQDKIGILLVEHDMSLVMRICSRVQVIELGRPIFVGTPAEVQGSVVVRRAYLGDPNPNQEPVSSDA